MYVIQRAGHLSNSNLYFLSKEDIGDLLKFPHLRVA